MNEYEYISNIFEYIRYSAHVFRIRLNILIRLLLFGILRL
jgi:hypothetical protein